MSTFLEIINKVLVRLREDTVANYNTTTYSTFIAGLVNQVKNEIEEAWDWHALRDSYTVNATNPNASYAFTDAGPKAVVLNAWNRTHGNEITKSTNKDFNKKFFGTPTGQSVPTGIVDKFVQTGVNDDYDVKADVYPVPNANQTLVFNLFVPQDDYAANGTVPLIPQDVLVEEVIARAMVEKGEEAATPPEPGSTFIRRDLLAAAVLRDSGADPSETDWEVE